MKNDLDNLINIQRNMKLEDLSNLIIDNYYYVIFDQKNIAELITRYSKKKHYQIFAKDLFKRLISIKKKIAIILLVT